jgi:membrane protease YdiL (CAAX protease family)
MSHSQPPSSVLDYATGSPRAARATDVLVWLMPIWCAIIIALAYWPVRHRDDPFWFAAMGLPFAVFLGCAVRRRWALAWYCLAVCLVVTAVGVALPSFNRAT